MAKCCNEAKEAQKQEPPRPESCEGAEEAKQRWGVAENLLLTWSTSQTTISHMLEGMHDWGFFFHVHNLISFPTIGIMHAPWGGDLQQFRRECEWIPRHKGGMKTMRADFRSRLLSLQRRTVGKERGHWSQGDWGVEVTPSHQSIVGDDSGKC